MIQFCLLAVITFFTIFFYTVMKMHANANPETHAWKIKRALV
jgi:flagellar biogenesis protein FliO